VEGAGDVGEVGDEPSIEITEANKRAYPLDRGGRLPLVNGGEFCGVHGDVSLLNDHAEVLYLGYHKGAFFKFQV
jgi:hypothetical protein